MITNNIPHFLHLIGLVEPTFICQGFEILMSHKEVKIAPGVYITDFRPGGQLLGLE